MPCVYPSLLCLYVAVPTLALRGCFEVTSLKWYQPLALLDPHRQLQLDKVELMRHSLPQARVAVVLARFDNSVPEEAGYAVRQALKALD